MAEIMRTVYFVFDKEEGTSNGKIFGDLGLMDFAKTRLTDDLFDKDEDIWNLFSTKPSNEFSLDECIQVLEADGWTVEQTDTFFSE